VSPARPLGADGPLARADAERLRACVVGGGIAVFPTDTVYGVCCDPEDAAAASRLYELKGRPAARPAAVMFFALEPALAALPELSERERGALQALLPGGLTLLLANPRRRYAPACAEDPATLGLRVPVLEGRCAALSATDVAVLQSSANISGAPDARRLEDVPARLLAGADLVLDGGELPGRPSTVLDLRAYADGGAWRIVREGAVPAADVLAALGAPE
jgi:L-threonylcarbamoyladenylate synthase